MGDLYLVRDAGLTFFIQWDVGLPFLIQRDLGIALISCDVRWTKFIQWE